MSTGALPLRTNTLSPLIYCWKEVYLPFLMLLYTHIDMSIHLSTVSSDHRLPVHSVPCGHRGSRLVHRLEPLPVGTCSSVMDLYFTCCPGSQNKRRGSALSEALPITWKSPQECWACHLASWEDICPLPFHKLYNVILSVGLVSNCGQSQTCWKLTGIVPV